ncbi:MAG: hypothetical protein ABI142_04230, partial [Bryocella sp.]
MAQLDLAPQRSNSSNRREQFRAVAWLRWRITVHQFRKKGGGGEIAGSIILWLLFSVFACGMMIAAATASAYAIESGNHEKLDLVLWGAFLLTQFVNIQIGQPGTVFDPTQLIRFPMNASSYIFLRLFFGLLTPGNMLIVLLSFAAAVGITVVQPSLWFYAFAGMAVFAITNALFSRMIFAWVDRWLATRRAREIFTAILILGGMVGQYLNVHLNPGLNHGDDAAASSGLGHAAVLYQAAERYARPLPPALITSSITSAQAHHFGAWALSLLACLAYACVFYAVFAWRTATEFRGENLTDTANAVRKAKSAAVRSVRSSAPLAAPTASVLVQSKTRSSALTAILSKEILQLRRNTGLIFGLIAPIFFVFLFAGRIASRNDSHWIFPLALVYVLMAIAPLSYNSFGLEGE